MRWFLLVTVLAVGGTVAFVVGTQLAGTRYRTPDFRLEDPDGRVWTDEDLEGRLSLIYFGFNTCPEICPTELGKIAGALDHLGGEASQVRPVFVTIDPERDTPEVMATVPSLYHPRLLPLRGDPTATAQAAAEFHVTYRKVPRESVAPGYYDINHTSNIFLLDRAGRHVKTLRRPYSVGDIVEILEPYLE